MTQQPKPTRSQQREEARAKAAVLRAERAKGDRRKRTTKRALIIVGALAAVSLVTVLVVNAAGSGSNGNNSNATPANFNSTGGIKIGTGLKAFTKDFTPTPSVSKPVSVVIYEDLQCPVCHQFEIANSAQLQSWVSKGQVTIEYHPLSFLDGNSQNAYSSRAGNALMCVGNFAPDQTFAYNNILYQYQPAEQTAGPDDTALINFMANAGVQVTQAIRDCVTKKTYGNYLSKMTAYEMTHKAIDGLTTPDHTPTILVNGAVYAWPQSDADYSNPAPRFAQTITAALAKN